VTRDVALVTGGAHGLGAHIVRALHQSGFRVCIADIDGDACGELAASLDPAGETILPIRLDVRHEDDFAAARDALLARWGSAEILVNNAAVTVARPVLEIPVEEFDQVIAVNLRGCFIGSQVFGRVFKSRGYGRIVNLASLAGQNGGSATGAHYAASKGGVMTLTKVFARDLAPFGITVNAVAPGPLESPAVHRIVPAERMSAFLSGLPGGRLGSAPFVAETVVRLCGRDAGFVNGATWDVNGGLHMR
jgi:3-oxoacyl-[acyl-carrier protein] reductase